MTVAVLEAEHFRGVGLAVARDEGSVLLPRLPGSAAGPQLPQRPSGQRDERQ